MKISDLADNSKRTFPLQEPIAIIGVGCRYSGNINNLEDFWKVLIEKKSTLKEVPSDRFSQGDLLFDKDRGYRKLVSKQGGWLDNLKKFDAKFFKISPREAEKVDPHQRLMLEVTFEAFEDAGLKLEDVWGSRTGVYAGMWSSDFEHVLTNSKDDIDVYSTTGSGRYAAAGRLAYFFNLQGPTFTIDTACSSSLVAIHLASQSLHLKESDLAVCSAANLILDPFISIGYSRSRLLSDYGKCRFGAKEASGYVRTEGSATVILKRLSDAERDGDFIYGIVPGSACNSDGQSHKHMLAPSAITQEIMIKDALSRANVAPNMIQYVEAHGTGTKAGDPAEIASIAGALDEGRAKDDTFYVGSIKTNLGHTEAASGVAGLLKVLLSIQHRTIPGNLYADEEKNEHIPWSDLKLQIPAQAVAWPHPDRPLTAGLNSFGISGTNAHVIIQEAPKRNIVSNSVKRKYKILPISAANEKALQEYSKLYLSIFEKVNSEDELMNLVKNISIRKADLPFRASIIFQSTADIINGLQAIIEGKSSDQVITGYNEEKKRTALVFPGQGSQWNGMGKILYESEPVFKKSIDQFTTACEPYINWNLTEVLFSGEDQIEIDIIQPTLLAIEIALAEWWKSIGLDFKAVIGHSMGEVGAAYIAGAITVDEAAAIICNRSLLMKKTSGNGSMTYIALAPDKVKEYFNGYEDQVGIGVHNSPASCVISGDPTVVDSIGEKLEETGAFVRKVKVNVASHSPQMEPLMEDLKSTIEWIQPKDASIEIFSSVLADEVNGGNLNASYWTKNLRSTVRFAETIQKMIQDGYGYFVEVSPHPTLLQPIQENAESLQLEVQTTGSIEREKDESYSLITQVATYYANGGRISWKKFYDLSFNKIQLPAYPWQREEFWVEEKNNNTQRSSSIRSNSQSTHPLLSQKVEMPDGSDLYIWETEINLKEFPYLKDHKIQDTIVFPGAGYLEIIWASIFEIFGEGGHLVQNVILKNALPLQENKSVTLQIILTQKIADTYKIEIYSYQENEDENNWVEHAVATIHINATQDRLSPNSLPLEIIERNTFHTISKEEHYQKTASISLPYGPAFQTVESLKTGENFILADISANDLIKNSVGKYFIHPAILDGFIQTFLSAIYGAPEKGTFVPVSIGKILLHNYQKTLSSGKIGVKITSDHYDRLIVNGVVYDEAGQVVLEIRDFELDRLESSVVETESEQILFETIDTPTELPTARTKDVLLFASDELTEDFLEQIQAKFIVKTGTFFAQNGNEFIIDPSNADHYTQIIQATKDQVNTIVHTWNLDEKSVSGLEQQDTTTLSVIYTLQAAVKTDFSPRLWVITDLVEKFPAQSTVLGLLNVVRNEHPEFKASSIQIDGEVDESILKVVLSDTEENSWKITSDKVSIERLSPLTILENKEVISKKIPVENTPFEVVTNEPGLLSNLSIQRKNLPPLASNHVQVNVQAIGINFMNLMSALGIYPGKVNGFATLGIECAGIVDAVGEDVTHLKVGDRVFGMAYHTMSSHIQVDASLMQIIPENLSFEEAATVPVVFLTVYYGLIVQARLQEGERVLIHSATGGVGLAAIQIAQFLGAEIYATAGSHEKRELLRSMGIEHVYDSRSLDFADRIMQDTSNEGIDVVLNSLTGSAMVESLELLRNFGRFVEIGKKDVYDNSQIGLQAFSKGLSYYMLDFEKMIFEKPRLVGELLGELLPFFENESFLPLTSKIFHVSEVEKAFDFMTTGKHIGKIVIQINPENVFIEESNSSSFSSNGTFLITGGYGGLGLTFAQYLVEKGVRRLILTGRSGHSEHPIIQELEKQGAEIIIAKADVGEREDLENVLSEYIDEKNPLVGVFHLAGILEDASILNIQEEVYYRVLDPKVLGSYNLHLVTQAHEIEHFVLFSSSTILFGSPGQAAYVSANRYMDALVAYRQRAGLPGLAIQWGTVSDVGLAASAENRSDRLKEEGIAPLTPQECTQIFDQVYTNDAPIVGAFRFDISKWEQAYPSAAKNHFYDILRENTPSESSISEEGTKELSQKEILADINDLELRTSTLENQLKAMVGKVVKLDPEDIHIKTTFKSLGIDSLMSIQLKNQLEKTYETALSVTAFWTHSNIRDYTRFLLEKIHLNTIEEIQEEDKTPQQPKHSAPIQEERPIAPPSVSESSTEESSTETKDKNVEDMSIDELSKLLDDELNDLLD
ncbi:MAG TPA: SDR family NAD(P)-dependent oxidoreductase [Chitinophagales bacterium]|nr:SDR family NAD(P)-dependent oxidoreductase [Chitinophagales bacterium]